MLPLPYMRILHLSWSDNTGGAAKAAYRTHKALATMDIDSSFAVVKRDLSDEDTYTLAPGIVKRLLILAEKGFSRFLTSGNLISFNFIGVYSARWINSFECDLVHIHWINNQTISLRELNKINKPIIVTLHDQWLINGIEHYTLENKTTISRLKELIRFRANLIVKKRQLNFLSSGNVRILTPNYWLKECIHRQSNLNGLVVNAINLPINEREWSMTRSIREKSKIILFGAVGGTKDYRKGYDILLDALDFIDDFAPLEIRVFGGNLAGLDESKEGIKIISLGRIESQVELNKVYSSSHLFVMPSRMDNSPLTIIESLISGTPVVCFKESGMQYMIDHKVNGFLADPFDPESLAKGIGWCLDNINTEEQRDLIRKNAILTYGQAQIAPLLVKEYKSFLSSE